MKVYKYLNKFKGHTDYVRSVRYSPDGKYIISGSEDGLLKIWDADTGKEWKSLNV